MSISPGMEYMERAYDDAKYGHYSKPALYRHGDSKFDRSLCGASRETRLSCFVQYAPYKLAEGTWDDQREAFGNNVIDTIAEHAPNIKDLIIDKQVLTPLDLEREFGLTQGNIFQGELSLEQLSSFGRFRAGRITARRSIIFSCAARRRILAAESWVPTDASPVRSF